MPSAEHQELAGYVFRMPLLLNPNFTPVGDPSIFSIRGGFLFEQMPFSTAEKMLERSNIPADKKIPYLLSILKYQLRLSEMAREGKLALAAIALDLPLKPQLQTIEHLVRSKQRLHQGTVPSPKLNGAARKLWPVYLRCLDAAEDGARPMEIFRQFVSEELPEIADAANEAAKIEGWIEAARQVQEKIIFYL